MFCSYCRSPNPDDGVYCTGCGRDLKTQRTPTPLSPGAAGSSAVGLVTDLPTGPVARLVPGQVTGLPTGPLAGFRVETLPAGTLIENRYEIESLLGQGGMAVVYRALDRKLERRVALKLISTRLQESEMGIARFEQEARAVASLNHANIVGVHDLGRGEYGQYISMELVEGGTLSQRIAEKGKVEGEEALGLVKGICQALMYAHRKGIVHRDLKPSNILLTKEGTPKVADFGLARMGASSLSSTGYGLGTPYYMAPEQEKDAKGVDHRADIYSLGATVYHLLTGEPPRAMRESNVPEEWRAAVMKAMEPKVEARYFTVEEFLRDMEADTAAPSTPRKSPSATHLGALSASLGETARGTCPQCGYENPAQARFCQGCGSGMFENCPKCGQEDRGGTKHCSKCGLNIPSWREAQGALARARTHLKAGASWEAHKEFCRALELDSGNEEAQRGVSETEQAIRGVAKKTRRRGAQQATDMAQDPQAETTSAGLVQHSPPLKSKPKSLTPEASDTPERLVGRKGRVGFFIGYAVAGGGYAALPPLAVGGLSDDLALANFACALVATLLCIHQWMAIRGYLRSVASHWLLATALAVGIGWWCLTLRTWLFLLPLLMATSQTVVLWRTVVKPHHWLIGNVVAYILTLLAATALADSYSVSDVECLFVGRLRGNVEFVSIRALIGATFAGVQAITLASLTWSSPK